MNKDLISTIENILVDISAKKTTATKVSDLSIMKSDILYELYVSLLVSEAVRRIKEVSDLHWVNTSSGEINIRKGPGVIYSNKNFSYLSFKYNKKKSYEIHLDVKYEGKTILHELDISILSEANASNYRNTKQNPKKDNLILGIECKQYSANLGIALGRQFVGLIDDMQKNSTFFAFTSNNYSKSIDEYYSLPNRPVLFGNLTADSSVTFTKIEEEFISYSKKQLEKKLKYLSLKS
ncbi:hypothetical protein JZO78_09465 [Enterococcus ureilyticus]|uniref:hypothetical protein n=1 Tax=Enterococcus ureilyticus TaxID=1131292 RepID=UPI001A9126B0|nr:hypothetical protein [Enterococcus ureilyticus]MBO0446573.1 hypothetical protein [Enterococcus ureilyticus]